jgi:cytochrome c553
MATLSSSTKLVASSCLFLAGALSAACTASAPSAARATASTTAAPTPIQPTAPPGPHDWDSWSHDQKLAYMKATVVNSERAAFASFEPVRYVGFDCKTCHGSGARDGSYRMPNPDLPKLAGGSEGFRELAQHEPEVVAFMSKVKVETAKLLGMKPWDERTESGFSCFGCHMRR